MDNRIQMSGFQWEQIPLKTIVMPFNMRAKRITRTLFPSTLKGQGLQTEDLLSIREWWKVITERKSRAILESKILIQTINE